MSTTRYLQLSSCAWLRVDALGGRQYVLSQLHADAPLRLVTYDGSLCTAVVETETIASDPRKQSGAQIIFWLKSLQVARTSLSKKTPFHLFPLELNGSMPVGIKLDADDEVSVRLCKVLYPWWSSGGPGSTQTFGHDCAPQEYQQHQQRSLPFVHPSSSVDILGVCMLYEAREISSNLTHAPGRYFH